MRYVLLLIIAVILVSATAASASDVLVIQGLRVKPYDQAVRGFRESCAADMRTFYLGDLQGADLAGLVRQEQPRLILAVGADALKKVRLLKGVPIVYLMVVNPQNIVGESGNITGVAMNVAPEKYLDILARISPRPKRVGIVYDPAQNGQFVRSAQQAAQAFGIELVVRQVATPREVPEVLDNLKGSVDALWMIPDTIAITPETTELFLLASQQQNIPVISFAGKYAAMGALAALEIDLADQGRQAGELATAILNGTKVADLPRRTTRKVTLEINLKVANKLSIVLTNSNGK